MHDPTKQDLIADHVEGQREHFDNVSPHPDLYLFQPYILQLEIHIGYVYPDATPPANASTFTPKFKAGARLPHAWIQPLAQCHALPEWTIDTSYVGELSTTDVAARRWSTLDLVAPCTVTLVAGCRSLWLQRFTTLQKNFGKFGLPFRLFAVDTDFEFTLPEQRALFEREGQFAEGGALLVRPDQHLLGCLGNTTTVEELCRLVGKETGLVPPLAVVDS